MNATAIGNALGVILVIAFVVLVVLGLVMMIRARREELRLRREIEAIFASLAPGRK